MSFAAAALDLTTFAESIDFTKDNLGNKICDIAFNCMLDNMDQEMDPDGNPWPPLSEEYAKWKDTEYPGRLMGYLHGVMKTLANMEGERVITPTTITMTFGLDQESKDEGEWFAEGDPAHNRPPRPFWGITDLAEQRIAALIDQHMKERG